MTEEVTTNRGWRIINTQQGMGGSGNRFKRGKQREEEKLNIENTRQKDSTWKIDKKLASHGNTHDKQSRNISTQ